VCSSDLASYPRQRGEGFARLAGLAACAASFVIDHLVRNF
jgi:hypothetical protein